jgi:hypothetical protein
MVTLRDYITFVGETIYNLSTMTASMLGKDSILATRLEQSFSLLYEMEDNKIKIKDLKDNPLEIVDYILPYLGEHEIYESLRKRGIVSIQWESILCDMKVCVERRKLFNIRK